MQRSSFQRRRPIGLAAVVAVAALGAGSAAAPAGAASAAAGAGKTCGTVAGATSHATWTKVELVKVRGLSCGAARRVVRLCTTRATVKGWARTASTSSVGLRNGKRRLTVKVLTGDVPTCLERQRVRVGGGVGVGAGAPGRGGGLGAVTWRTAGPHEGPMEMPPTSTEKWRWESPVGSRGVNLIDVSSASMLGIADTSEEKVRAVWFEYGKTRDLGTATAKQAPKTVASGAGWSFAQPLKSLDAKTRYYWRAAASLDTDGGPRTFYGATGSFVTEGYRSASGENPCAQSEFGGASGGTTEVTEALAIVCSPRMELVNSVGLPVSVGYNGRLTCPRAFPRNLNVGDTTVTIPKIDYTVRFNKIVNYWRSNDSARFTTFPGYQEHFGGAETGPLLGWHEWNVDQWGYLGSTSRTLVQMWINCTDNWQAFTTEQLARGEGDDKPSATAPGAPRNFRFVAADGGWNGTWQAPERSVPGGIAGYELIVDSLPDSSSLATVALTNTGLSGRISAAYVKAMADIFRTKRLYAHVWAISGEGVRSATSGTVAITAP